MQILARYSKNHNGTHKYRVVLKKLLDSLKCWSFSLDKITWSCNCVQHDDITTYWGMEIKLHQFLILELKEGNWSTASSGHFRTGERAFGITGRKMCINVCIKVKFSFEDWGSHNCVIKNPSILRCYAVPIGKWSPTLWQDVLPLSVGLKNPRKVMLDCIWNTIA